MDILAGMEPTERQVVGPASKLVELADGEGLKHLAIVFDEKYRHLGALTTSVNLALNFLRCPLVLGLVELKEYLPDQGAFIYPTGSAITVAEILASYRQTGKAPGHRAGLEMCFLAGLVLTEARDSGMLQGVYSHGDLSPWRMLVQPDGEVQVIGYGLPQPDLVLHREQPKHAMHKDAYRYCPPERIEGQPEDLAADLTSLVLITIEMMTGTPLFDGTVDEMRTQAVRAEGLQRLKKFRKKLPDSVYNVFSRCLIYDPASRYEDGVEFTDDVEQLLKQGVEGPSLAEVVAKITGAKATRKRQARTLKSEATGMFTPGQLASMADDDDDDDDDEVKSDAAPAADGRWAKSARARKGADEAEEKPKRSLRRSKSAAPPADDPEEEETPKRSLRRSARSASTKTEEGPARRSLRRSRSSAESTEEDEAPKRSLRRSSRSGDDDASPSTTSARRLKRASGSEESPSSTSARRLTRSKAPEGDPSPSTSSARRLSRSTTATPQAEEKPKRLSRSKAKEPDVEAPEAEEKPQRASRSGATAKEPEIDAAPEAAEKPKRTSLSRTKAKKPEVEASEKPNRSARSRSKAKEEEAEEAAEKPKSRRLSRSSSGDDKKPASRRLGRKGTESAHEEPEEKPKRRLSRSSSTDEKPKRQLRRPGAKKDE